MTTLLVRRVSRGVTGTGDAAVLRNAGDGDRSDESPGEPPSGVGLPEMPFAAREARRAVWMAPARRRLMRRWITCGIAAMSKSRRGGTPPRLSLVGDKMS